MRALLFLCLFMTTAAWAIDPSTKLSNPQHQALYEKITQEVRCLVCQNNTIADSTAPLAADLRRVISTKIEAGQDEEQIKDFLVERYGDFILYKPRFKSWNIVLWLVPAVFLLIGAIALARIVKQRSGLPINEDAP